MPINAVPLRNVVSNVASNVDALYNPTTGTLTLEHLNTTGDSGVDQFNHASTSGAIAFDFANGNVQAINLEGDCTFTFSNLKNGYTYIIAVTQDVNGGWTIAFPASLKWNGGTAPTVDTRAETTTLLTFVSIGSFEFGSVITGC